MLIDSHCHLDMLDDVDAAIARAVDGGVERMITIGVDAESNEAAVRAADANERVYATVGLHPHDARLRTDALMERIARLAAHQRVVGIGEAGLDYHYDNSPRDQQRAVFAEQIRMAIDLDMTLVIHSRDAWDDTFAVLADEGVPERVVFHCFSGGPAEAERALSIGAVLSFSGVVTFKNAQPLRDAAIITPVERMIVETDAPFLTPVPHRGARNEPAFVVHTARALASIKGVDEEAFFAVTASTTERAFTL